MLQVLKNLFSPEKKAADDSSTTAHPDSDDTSSQPAPQPSLFRQPSIDELLQQLPEDMRRSAHIGLVRKEVSNDPQAIDDTIAFYSHTKAGVDEQVKLKLKKGEPEQALQILLNDSPIFILSAAEFAEKHISVDRAIAVFEDAIKSEQASYNHSRFYEELVKLYDKKGDANNTEQCFNLAIAEHKKKPEHLHFAVQLADKRGKKALALELAIEKAERDNKYMEVESYADAAQRAEELGDKRATALYERALNAGLNHEKYLMYSGNKGDILSFARKVGTPDAMIKAHIQIANGDYRHHVREGHYHSAAEIAKKAAYALLTVAFYRKAKEPEKAVDFLVEKGRIFSAITLAKQDIGGKQAAYLALEHQRSEEALKCVQESLSIPHLCKSYEDPEYFRIAIRASDALNNEEQKQRYLQEGIERFSTLGNFAICKEFALQQENTRAAMVYDKLAKVKK